ncbi:helix-turn-helix domain-containing protein [Candidatus Kaiserbacteria bacterium]|nr:helix-turn-helix domain-containing protein [Candidatus Kaiserbacteria bacterium]
MDFFEKCCISDAQNKHSGLSDKKVFWRRGREQLWTVPEVARLLKVSVPSVRRLIQHRHISFCKVGGSIRFSKRDITSFLEGSRVESIN